MYSLALTSQLVKDFVPLRQYMRLRPFSKIHERRMIIQTVYLAVLLFQDLQAKIVLAACATQSVCLQVDMVLKNFELPHNRALALRMAITVMTGKSAMPRYGRHYEPAILSRLDYFCQEHPLPRDVHITDHKLKVRLRLSH